MLTALPLYLAFLGTAVALLALALTAYLMVTPHHEIRLIRGGNRAAACSFGGTAIGMAIVLYSTASSTFEVVELASGADCLSAAPGVSCVSMMVPKLRQGIEADNVAYGILLGALSIAMGILNAGALSE